MVSWADPNLESRPRMPVWLLPGAILTCVSTIMLPPSLMRKFVGLLVIFGTMNALPMYSTGNVAADYESMIVCWMLLFKFLDLAVLSKPEDDFRRVPRKWKEDDSRVEDEGKPDRFLGKLKWSADLFWNCRGVGWNWKVSNIPANDLAFASKGLFLTETIFRIIFALTGAIFTSSIMLSAPQFSTSATSASIYNLSYPRKTLVNFSSALVLIFGMNATYWSFAVFSTFSNLTNPEDWPPLMSNPATAYTIRRAWSITYHQTFRRIFTVSGAALIKYFRISQASRMARIIYLIISFGTSAIFHHAAGVMIGQGSMGVYVFFGSQIGGILFEDVVTTFAEFWGYKCTYLTKMLGYFWVLWWFSVSLTPYVDGLAISGYGSMVARLSNIGTCRYLLLPYDSLHGEKLWWRFAYGGILYGMVIALLIAVRRILLPGRIILDWSVLGI